MTEDKKKGKRLVALAYATLFLSLFAAATYTGIARRIEDAKHAQEAAPPASSSTGAAPVGSR